MPLHTNAPTNIRNDSLNRSVCAITCREQPLTRYPKTLKDVPPNKCSYLWRVTNSRDEPTTGGCSRRGSTCRHSSRRFVFSRFRCRSPPPQAKFRSPSSAHLSEYLKYKHSIKMQSNTAKGTRAVLTYRQRVTYLHNYDGLLCRGLNAKNVHCTYRVSRQYRRVYMYIYNIQ